jgi:hypothetical protein
VSSCSGLNQPCGSGCCPGLECTANGTCAYPPPPTCAPGSTACEACLAKACCPQLSACQAAASCAKALACLQQCLIAAGDLATCAAQCNTGAPELQTLGLCGYQSCAGSCY